MVEAALVLAAVMFVLLLLFETFFLLSSYYGVVAAMEEAMESMATYPGYSNTAAEETFPTANYLSTSDSTSIPNRAQALACYTAAPTNLPTCAHLIAADRFVKLSSVDRHWFDFSSSAASVRSYFNGNVIGLKVVAPYNFRLIPFPDFNITFQQEAQWVGLQNAASAAP